MVGTSRLLGAAAVAAYTAGHLVPSLAIKDSFVQTLLVYFVFLFLVNFTYNVFIYPLFLSPLNDLPTPPNSHWLFGQGQKIAKEATGLPMREWNNTIPNDGLIAYRFWFNIERLLITSPDALREVLVTKAYDFHKPWQVKKALGRILGDGILIQEGDEHKRQRKHLSPAFAFRHIKDLYPQFWDKSVEMVERIAYDIKTRDSTWQKENNALEISDYTSRTTLDIIGLTGMGQDFGAIKDPYNTLAQHYKTIFKPPKWQRFLQMLGMILPPWFLHRLPIKRNEEILQARTYIRDTCKSLITTKRQAMAEKRPGFDILSVALESGGFTDESLTDQMMTFLVAGHETTSTAMIWALWLLSTHPEVQERLRQEIHDKLSSPRTPEGRTVDSTQIDALPYLTAVVNESLRLWSPVTMTMRVATRDTSILSHVVPKGTTLIISPWATNTSYALWGADAMEFKPERWLTGVPPAESNFSFLTFLHGPRGCIGERFSRSEFACMLAAAVGRFEWGLDDPAYTPKIGGMITPRPKDGLWLRVKEVEKW